ncbi:MAG: FAD-binding oxidoreductase, partial [Microvirga sp.]
MPESHSDLLGVLSARLGAKHVIVDPAEMEGYLVEERKLYRGTALAVVRPGSTDEVAFVVRECATANVAVVPQGGNTGLVGGGVPHRGIVLSLARLDRIREVNAFNATITAEAGCVLKTVQDAAKEVDCIFPLSLASEGSCRIGGNISTNAGGVNVLRYGNTRDLVLGLEVVLADGRIWNGLKSLRKDNTGYDLKNLFIGSEGTLGIITAAVLKLFPQPKTKVVAFVGCASPHAALELFETLRQTMGDELTAFEFMPRFALEIVLKHAAGAVPPLAGEHEAYALIELSSPDPEIDLGERLERVLGEALEAGIVEDAVIAASEAQGEA